MPIGRYINVVHVLAERPMFESLYLYLCVPMCANGQLLCLQYFIY